MTIGNNLPCFEILRAGINTTIQDIGRNNLYHLGITMSGAVDQRNFRIIFKQRVFLLYDRFYCRYAFFG